MTRQLPYEARVDDGAAAIQGRWVMRQQPYEARLGDELRESVVEAVFSESHEGRIFLYQKNKLGVAPNVGHTVYRRGDRLAAHLPAEPTHGTPHSTHGVGTRTALYNRRACHHTNELCHYINSL